MNETVSGKTQVERRDRKGMAMAVGTEAHALWGPDDAPANEQSMLRALWERRQRAIFPIRANHTRSPHALHADDDAPETDTAQTHVEALSLGRWVAISGAAFTTGAGANTQLGLSLLLGLANVRLGYWWDSGISSRKRRKTDRPTFIELASRLIGRVLPGQTCLMSEFFARFHGPA